MATEIQAPNAYKKDRFTLFLAGSIDQNTAEQWQDAVVQELSDYDVLLLNPRRDDWNDKIEQDADNPEFAEQVNWEQDGLEAADFRIFYFAKDSKSPITFSEWGECLDLPGVTMCPKGFYRKGNVDLGCRRNDMPEVESFEELIGFLKKTLDEKGLKSKTANRGEPHIAALMESVQSGMLLPPAVVDREGKITDGRHRIHAASRLGIKQIPYIRLMDALVTQPKTAALPPWVGRDAYRNTVPLGLSDIQQVPVDQIDAYEGVDDGKVEELKEALSQGADIPPLIVDRNRSGHGYTIVDGHHRFEAAKGLGFSRVPVRIRGEKQAAKTAAPRQIMYHGTSRKNLRSILSQGLVTNSKKRWDKDEDRGPSTVDRTSYGGCYVTTNLLTALGAPADRREQGGVVVVCAEVQPNTLVLDEDDITGKMNAPLGRLSQHEHSIGCAYLAATLPNVEPGWREQIATYKDEYVESILNSLKYKFEERGQKMHPDLIGRLRKLIVDTWLPAVSRIAVHLYKSADDYHLRSALSRVVSNREAQAKPQIQLPSVDQAEADFREHVDQITRTLRQLARINGNSMFGTARVLEPIGYSGANRIVAVVEILDSQKQGDGNYGPAKLIVRYGTLPEDFLEKYRKNVGSNFEVVESGQEQKAASVKMSHRNFPPFKQYPHHRGGLEGVWPTWNNDHEKKRDALMFLEEAYEGQITAAKTASPDFGYSQYNDREKDLKKLRITPHELGKHLLEVTALLPGQSDRSDVDDYPGYVTAESYNYPPTTPPCKDGASFAVNRSFIRPEWRGTGLGQMLYDEIIKEARRKGAKYLFSDESRSDDAENAWKRLSNRYPVTYDADADRYKVDLLDARSKKVAREQEIEADNAAFNEDGYWSGDKGASGILPIARDTKRICLAWRNKKVHTGDVWGVIGGACKDGMEPGPSAVAEMKEEVGYDGPIELHKGFTFVDGDFRFVNYCGIVPSEFSFNPSPKSAWETDYIHWFTLEEVLADMEENAGDYHPGVLTFFKESRELIEKCVKGEAKTASGKVYVDILGDTEIGMPSEGEVTKALDGQDTTDKQIMWRCKNDDGSWTKYHTWEKPKTASRTYTSDEVAKAGNDWHVNWPDITYLLQNVPVASINGGQTLTPDDYRDGGPSNHYQDGTDDEVEYIRKMQHSLDALPPIVLSSDLSVWDGNHRLTAYADAGRTTIPAFVASADATEMSRRMAEQRNKTASENPLGDVDAYEVGSPEAGPMVRPEIEPDGVEKTASPEDLDILKANLQLTDAEKGEELARAIPINFKDFIREEHPEYESLIPEDEDDYIEDYSGFPPDVLLEFLNQHSSYLMENDPAYAPSFLYMDFHRDFNNAWLVHFTQDAEKVAQEGFTYGVDDPRYLGMTTAFTDQAKVGGGYNFAFDATNPRRWNSKYGHEAVVFQASGIEVYHYGDEEYQCIFWGADAHNLTAINGEYEVLDKNGGVVYAADSMPDAVQWVMKNSKRVGKAASSTCTCGHPFSDHKNPPDFGCVQEPGCGCKGFTEKKVAATQPVMPEGFKPWFDGTPAPEPGSSLIHEPFDEVTSTPEFHAWFEGSKVLDIEGHPLVVYHGTSSETKQFVSRNNGYGRVGHWFDAYPQGVERYTGGSKSYHHPNVIAAFLSIKNPKNYPDMETFKAAVHGKYGPTLPARAGKLRTDLKKAGFDGIVIRNSVVSKGARPDYWVAFDTKQIKSATGNSGAFSTEDKSIVAAAPTQDQDTDYSQQTDSPAFKAWFGKSKIVDDHGRPLRMFHGSKENFDAFDAQYHGRQDTGWMGVGFYFTDKPGVASGYALTDKDDYTKNAPGAVVYPVFLSVQNPKVIHDFDEIGHPDTKEAAQELTEQLQEQGYDGVVLDHLSPFSEVCVFYPNQIKSAIGNNGEFSSHDHRITASKTAAPSTDEEQRNFAKTFPDERAFMDYHQTGYIPSHAYDRYNKEGGLDWVRIDKHSKQIGTFTCKDGRVVELRQNPSVNKYVATDENGDNKYGDDGLAIYMTPEEIKAEGLPETDTAIIAVYEGKCVGLASDEFGSDGIWVVPSFQKQGLGVKLLSELRKQFRPERRIGQMTNDGYNMAHRYYRSLVDDPKKASKTAALFTVDEVREIGRRYLESPKYLAALAKIAPGKGPYDDLTFEEHDALQFALRNKTASKTAYLSPKDAELAVAIDLTTRKQVTITLDTGIPRFTVFSISIPVDGLEEREVIEYAHQAFSALLDEVLAFMVSLKYEDERLVEFTRLAERCWAGLSFKDATDHGLNGRDPDLRMYEATFELPEDFINETHAKVVTAATVVKRLPVKREIHMTEIGAGPADRSAARAIQMYRNRSMKSLPKPYYVMVYDQKGRIRGAVPVARNWESRLLKRA